MTPTSSRLGATGSGLVRVLVNKESSSLECTIEVEGLSGVTTGAYIFGPADLDFVAASGMYQSLHKLPLFVSSTKFSQTHYIDPDELTPTLEAFSKGDFGVRVHTTMFSSGEVRGFLYPCTEERWFIET